MTFNEGLIDKWELALNHMNVLRSQNWIEIDLSEMFHHYDMILEHDIEMWLSENLDPEEYFGISGYWLFKNPKDVTLFLLRWS